MDRNPVLFSVVVPIYNVKPFLRQCIESVLQQTYTKFELILVDDGSTDGSAQICDRYSKMDARVKVIHKQNAGLVSARKAGIAKAKGAYAICLDGDDWISNRYLQELWQIITEYAPDIVCFGYYKANEQKMECNRETYRKGYYSKKDLERAIYPSLIRTDTGSAFTPAIWAKAYRMGLYREEQLLIDDRIMIAEDAACTIPCMLRADSAYILDEPLYYYRINNLSMTRNRKPFSWDGPELIERHLRRRITESGYGLQRQISRRTVQALVNVVKTQFYGGKHYSETKAEIVKYLERPIYRNALLEGRFKRFSIIELCRVFLLHKIIFPFYLLSKLR